MSYFKSTVFKNVNFIIDGYSLSGKLQIDPNLNSSQEMVSVTIRFSIPLEGKQKNYNFPNDKPFNIGVKLNGLSGSIKTHIATTSDPNFIKGENSYGYENIPGWITTALKSNQ